MILGLVFIIVGFVIMFSAEVETTQFFSGWVFGTLALCTGPGLQGVQNRRGSVVVGFVVSNRDAHPKPKASPARERCVVNGASKCICFPSSEWSETCENRAPS